MAKEMDDTIAQQTKKIIVQESQNQKLKVEKDKFSEEVHKVFQEKVKISSPFMFSLSRISVTTLVIVGLDLIQISISRECHAARGKE
jgi:hypothetical protein